MVYLNIKQFATVIIMFLAATSQAPQRFLLFSNSSSIKLKKLME
jgi:hypothetical protein